MPNYDYRRRPQDEGGPELSAVVWGIVFCLLITLWAFYPALVGEDSVEESIEQPPTQPQKYRPAPSQPSQHFDPQEPMWFPVSDEVKTMIRSRSVFIDARDSYVEQTGTGGRIGNNLVLTDLHVIVDKALSTIMENIRVDGRAASVLKWDAANDLAILQTSGYDSTPALDLRYDPALITINQKIVTVGNPYGNHLVFQTGIISRDEYWERGQNMFGILVIQDGYGASGSLVYTDYGQCIGILQQTGFQMDRLFVIRNLSPVERLLRSISR